MGEDSLWDKAEGALQEALQALKLPFTINPGDGAFYGPKLDIMFVDALKRPWQLGTLQIDFNMPQAFQLSYVAEDNRDHQPVMLHRAILGSLERFIGVYLEHTAGHFPLWMSPQQVSVLTVTDRQLDYGRSVDAALKAAGIRSQIDERSEKLGYKIREAQLQKVPYMLILGDKEVAGNTVSVRLNNGQVLEALDVQQFITQLNREIGERKLQSVFQSATKNINQEASNSSI
jgi:threonyl-tRNA synthetase